MVHLLKSIIIFAAIIHVAMGANILLLYALYGKSHLLSYVPFLQQ